MSIGAAVLPGGACDWQAADVVHRRGVQPPRTYVREEGTWPTGPWAEGTPRSILVTAEIAQRLRASISSAGISTTEAAARIGISRQALHEILSGRRIPDLHTLVEAEDALGVTPWPGQ